MFNNYANPCLLLQSVSIMLLGVAVARVDVTGVMLLGLGSHYYCWGSHTVGLRVESMLLGLTVHVAPCGRCYWGGLILRGFMLLHGVMLLGCMLLVVIGFMSIFLSFLPIRW